MKSNLRVLYRTTLDKYSKFKSRYDKNLRSGHFQSFSDRRKSQIIARLKRLYNRICELKLQLKLAVASGALIVSLSTATSSEAQQLGPFVQNDLKNPFKPPSSSISNNQNPVAVDIDNDGDLDIFIGYQYGGIRFLRNDGTATSPRFVRQYGSNNPLNGVDVGYNSSPTFADLDKDGDLDLIIGQRYQYLYSPYQNTRFYRNTGTVTNPIFVSGGFPNPADDIFADANYGHPAYGDIDNDGDLDALVGGALNTFYSSRETITFWRNSGSLPLPQFSRENGSANPFAIVNPDFGGTIDRAAPALVDIDNDGDLDLFVGEATGTIRFFENTGNAYTPLFAGESTGSSNPLDGITFDSNASPEFADLDGDGDFDIIVGEGGYRPLQFIRNDGNSSSPNFVLSNRIDNPFDGVDTEYDAAPSIVDLDGDGFLDVVIGQKYDETLLLFTNNQNGTFSERTGAGNPFDDLLNTGDANTQYERIDPDFADIDNDGDFDLFVAVRKRTNSPFFREGQILFFRNSGNATNPVFVQEATPISITPDYNQVGITVGDFDNDSDFDVLLGGYDVNSGGSNFLFFNNAGNVSTPNFTEIATNFPPVNSLDVGDNYLKPQFVDLDHDGDLDVVSGAHEDYLSGQLLFFKNDNGDLNYQTGVNSPFFDTGSGVNFDFGSDSHPAFIDVDNDGDLDVLVGIAPGHIILLENQNTPTRLFKSVNEITFTEGDNAKILDGSMVVADDDNDLIVSSKIEILNTILGEDRLSFTPQFGITGSFSASRGELNLTGSATIAQYRAVLRTVTYENTSTAPTENIRNIQFSVRDFDNTDPSIDIYDEPIISVTIVSVNDVPIVTASSLPNATYNEDDTPGVLIDENFIINDGDNTTLEGATVQITANFISAEDVLEFTDQNAITGSYDNTTGILTLSGVASLTNYQTALRSVRYSNSSQNPDDHNRTIDFNVTDGTDNSNIASRVVLVVPINDAPVVSSSNTVALDYDQNTTAIIVDDLIDIVDVDDTQLVSATVMIAGYQTGDILAGTAPSGGSVDFDAGTGILTLSGTATLAEYISALSTVTFSSDQSGSRQLNFTVNDGTDNSNIYSRDLNIIVPNEAPVIASTGSGSIDYEQNEEAIILDISLTINDLDDTNIESISVSISGYVAGDTLIITEPTGTTSSFDDLTGILTVIGSAPIEDYETALQSLSFASTNGTGARQILIVANDGDDDSNTFTIDVNISDEIIPQPPVVNTTPGTTQEGSKLTIDLCNIISDPDNTFDELIITVVSITSGAITSVDGCDLVIDYEGLDFSGTDSIVLRATDPDGNTDQNTLTITVEEEPVVNGGNLVIYNAISPNGDGYNDWWEIINLTTPNKIELYNRWGDLVKTLNNYENIEDNTQLDDLGVGTYFYKISSPQGDYTGYITIKK